MYIALLIFVVILGVGLSAVSEMWSVSAQRQREEELLFIGNQYRQAITHYYTSSLRGAFQFPHQLEDLVDDNRNPDKPLHHLRRLYADPMTGKADWGEVTLPDGSIVGVYSRSLDPPMKQSGFRVRDITFVDQTRYADWVFRSPLPAANPSLGTGGYGSTKAGPSPQIPITNGPIRGTPGSQGGAINRPFMGR